MQSALSTGLKPSSQGLGVQAGINQGHSRAAGVPSKAYVEREKERERERDSPFLVEG